MNINCSHRFVFPSDRETITGRCKCGATQKAYGMRWMIERTEDALEQRFFDMPKFDKYSITWYNKKR